MLSKARLGEKAKKALKAGSISKSTMFLMILRSKVCIKNAWLYSKHALTMVGSLPLWPCVLLFSVIVILQLAQIYSLCYSSCLGSIMLYLDIA